jgi:hypothetical protein
VEDAHPQYSQWKAICFGFGFGISLGCGFSSLDFSPFLPKNSFPISMEGQELLE